MEASLHPRDTFQSRLHTNESHTSTPTLNFGFARKSEPDVTFLEPAPAQDQPQLKSKDVFFFISYDFKAA